MTWRPNLAANRTPVQQAMTVEDGDYRNVKRLHRLMLGVVIDVFPCDQEEGNRSARQLESRHGHRHEATVLVINDGASTYMVLENVTIPPFAPSGVDNYAEHLPRPSSCLTTGEAMSSGLNQVDPYDLDGDMCVIAFIGGQLDQPFIISWWPHPRNLFDSATSGVGHPNAEGQSQALDQSRRYFRRINGVETVINSIGDVIVSTTFSGSSIVPGQDSERGRFIRREHDDLGGSVRLYMKPSRTMEWVWAPQEDGLGILSEPEGELPQPNPPSEDGGPEPDEDEQLAPVLENTYLYVSGDSWRISVPSSFQVISMDEVILQADGEVEIDSVNGQVLLNAGDLVTLQARNVVSLTSPAKIELRIENAESGPDPEDDASIPILPDYAAITLERDADADTISITIGVPDPAGTETSPLPDLSFITMNDAEMTIESTAIKIGENASTEPLVLGATLDDVLTNAVVQTAMGPAMFDAATIARFVEFQSTKTKVE